MLRRIAALTAAVAVMTLSGCGYNQLQTQDEGIKAAWSEVLNQYQRRADLVPNLVSTVKGYAAQEEKVLTEVTNARASVAGIKATPELINDPAAFDKFIKAQGELQGALSHLVRIEEMRQSLRIIEQAAAQMPPGRYICDDYRYGAPQKSDTLKDIVSLIHHLINVTRGPKIPRGEAYAATEIARGEQGYYVVSDGLPTAYRMRIRTPGFANVQVMPINDTGTIALRPDGHHRIGGLHSTGY